MKSILIAFVVALTMGASLLAKDLTFTACTADQKIAELTVTLVDDASTSTEVNVRTAFVNAAKGLTAEALQARDGFVAFKAGLSAADWDAIVSLSGPPDIVAGSCK